MDIVVTGASRGIGRALALSRFEDEEQPWPEVADDAAVRRAIREATGDALARAVSVKAHDDARGLP